MARVARILAVVGAVVVLAFYAEILAHAPVTGQDFRTFYAAATVLRHGGNPYDMRQLLRQEEQLYHPASAQQRAALAGNPYVQGPPLAIALMPLLQRLAAALYTLYAVVAGAMAALALILLAMLWPARQSIWRAVALLISPVTFLGVLLGQPDALLLLVLVAALWALRRGCPAAAGFVLMVGLVKPQIMLGPIILLALLAQRHGRLRPYLAGVLSGAAAFLGGSLLVAGPTVVAGWAQELAGFGGTTVYTQVDISSLSTLYVGWAPHRLATALALVAVAAWAMCCAWLWRSRRGRGDEAWPFVVALTGWLLATPYAHPHDDILLLPVMWYLLDRAPYRGLTRPLAVLLFASWWLLPMTSVLGLRLPLLRGLGIVPVVVLLTILLLTRYRTQWQAALAVVVPRAS